MNYINMRWWCSIIYFNSIVVFYIWILPISYFDLTPFPLSIIWKVSEYSLFCSGTGTPIGLCCLTLSILIYCCTLSRMIIGEYKLQNDLTTSLLDHDINTNGRVLCYHMFDFCVPFLNFVSVTVIAVLASTPILLTYVVPTILISHSKQPICAMILLICTIHCHISTLSLEWFQHKDYTNSPTSVHSKYCCVYYN